MNRYSIILLLLSIGSSAFGQRYYQVNTENLNVRKSTSVHSNIVGKLKLGDSVYATRYDDEWTQIRLQDGKYGYVSTKYISVIQKRSDKETEKTSVWGTILVLGLIIVGAFKHFRKRNGVGKSTTPLQQRGLRWFFCKHCSEKVQSHKKPTSANCSEATFHHWTELGEVGNRNFNCENCGVTVWTVKKPTSLNCSNKKFHHWTEL